MDLDGVFKNNGLIARHLKNYEFRPEQIQMAKAVEKAIDSKKHLVVEAGTGIGKTLSYLIPFIHWAVKENKKAVISTYTKTLQEQLVKKDLPFLQKALGIKFKFALCLGGQNYLCLRRFEQNFPGDILQKSQINKITEWRKKTKAGIRSEINFKNNGSIWSKICRESDLCLGKNCVYREDCFYKKARLAGYKSQVLVINHHLYFANLASGGMVLPDFEALVFDEAHTLEETAVNYLGIEISNFRIKYFLDSIFNPYSGKGFLAKIKNSNRRKAENIKDTVSEVKMAAELFFSEIISKFGQSSRAVRVRNKNFVFNHLKEPLLGLISMLAGFLDNIKNEEEKMEMRAFVSRGKEINCELETIINMTLNKYVYWIEIRPSAPSSKRPHKSKRIKCSLYATPIDVSTEFKVRVLDKIKPIIFTSATLSANGSFEFKMRGLGINDAEELLLGSPFDYKGNSLLYLPESLPDPSIEFESYQMAVIAEIKRILSIMKGGTFVLFTNFKMLETVYDIIRGELTNLTILKQGEENRYTLLEKFKRQNNCVLLGTNSFWQGVDVPGEALECVIVTKLPFSVPDDPVTEARIEELQAQRIDPFLHYQIPQAIIMLRQGLGRLIRRKTDIGMTAILDPRIKTKFYGRSFLQALPECRYVSRLEEVQEFFLKKKKQAKTL
ncbi:MAG: ATP-dependent DNA helicase [Candidatus Ratteibacteria bacterium]|nr:ATP-dependent DNA helicase [Candidatus Ratteibacteria bacterium]